MFDVPGFRYRSPENGKKRDDAARGRKGSLDVGKMKANRKPPFSSLRSAAEKRRRPRGLGSVGRAGTAGDWQKGQKESEE